MQNSFGKINALIYFGDGNDKKSDWFYAGKDGTVKIQIPEEEHRKLCFEISSILYKAVKKLFI